MRARPDVVLVLSDKHCIERTPCVSLLCRQRGGTDCVARGGEAATALGEHWDRSYRDVRLARRRAATGGRRQASVTARTAQPAHGWVPAVTPLTPHRIIQHLVVIENGTFSAGRYVTKILNDYVSPFLVGMGGNAIFMQDNARPHTAQIVFAYFREVGITYMEWPAPNPDLNSIKHSWDELVRRGTCSSAESATNHAT
ncbi:unnamed protein product [Euphydryas editha]|uniref:Tc1-like transposase DDE domain-containing protein n=1 Tax=Euphydryas editha TaxID=104508 RepID=A0AAU9TFF4_EUPED|nr:unnamed protein product [Euphydryas editha]